MMALIIIFCKVDDFCKIYLENSRNCALPDYTNGSRQRERNMSLSEIMSLHIYYAACSHKYKTFKAFYECRYAELAAAFPGLVSYERTIELKQEILVPLAMFLLSILADCTGITYVDSTAIEACHIKRASYHATLRNIATFGKTTNGWFYGTKLHLFLNEYSEIVACLFTPGNVADNNHNLLRKMSKKLWGKLFGDKGYIITPEFWQELYQAGLQVIHGLRSNMANKLMTQEDKFLYRKRANVSEGGFSMLKSRMSLEYTRVRSLYGYFCNVIVMLISYQFWAFARTAKLKAQGKKPRMAKKKQIRMSIDLKNALLATS